jgi:acetylcholinesterase
VLIFRILHSTDSQLKQYIQSIWLPNVSDGDLDTLLKLYPADITQGSPFDTGAANALTPQFKRIAAFQGDAVFQGPRRYFLQQRSGKQDIWSFREKNSVTTAICGLANYCRQ